MIGSMATNQLPLNPDALLSLVERVKENYQMPLPAPVKRGKQRDFSGRSFLLLAAVAVTLRTFRDSELRQLLHKDECLRRALEFTRVPHRTTIGRRLTALVAEAEAQIAALGRVIVEEVKPGEEQTQVSAIDGRMYQAQGPRWHQQDREQARLPLGLRNIDTESKWSKSGYRGWVQGYRLVLQGLVFPCPVPIFAAWRANNLNEAHIAQAALARGALPVTEVLLGDETFGKGEFPQRYARAGGFVLSPPRLPPHRRSWKDALYDYRKETIELLFQRVTQAADLKACQVKGEGRNGAFVLASVWLYQVCFLEDYREGKPLAHVKDHLDCARWRIPSSG
jgi:hypothetical protein